MSRTRGLLWALACVLGCAGPPESAPPQVTLAPDVLEGLAEAAERPFHDRESLPPVVQAQLTTNGELLANPGDDFNDTCVMTAGLPGQRLVEAGTAGALLFVLYEQGGFVCMNRLLVARLDAGGDAAFETVPLAGEATLAAAAETLRARSDDSPPAGD